MSRSYRRVPKSYFSRSSPKEKTIRSRMNRRGERAKLKLNSDVIEELDEPYEITKFDIVEPRYKPELPSKEHYTTYSEYKYWNSRARRK